MKKLKLVSFVIFCISLIFWFTQVRKGDRIGPVITMDQQELTVGLNATDEDFLQGVKAVDDHTLQITLNQPESYWNSKLTLGITFPVNEKFVKSKGDKFAQASDTSSLLYNCTV